MSGNATMHDEYGRPTSRHTEVQRQRGIAQSHRPVEASHLVARPILNTIGVLKVLRQAFWTCRAKEAWWPLKYDFAPDDGLSLTEYGIDELDRALEALGELETLVKACERGAAP